MNSVLQGRRQLLMEVRQLGSYRGYDNINIKFNICIIYSCTYVYYISINLSIIRSNLISIHIPTYLSNYPPIYLCIFPSTQLPIIISIILFMYLYMYIKYPSMYPYIQLIYASYFFWELHLKLYVIIFFLDIYSF